jgi:hypothetical protein
MEKRPLPLTILGTTLCGIAISFPIQIIFLYGYQPTEWRAILSNLSLSNQLVMILLVTSAIAIFRASRLLMILTPLTIAAVFWNNWVVGSYGFDFSLTTTLSMSSLFSLSHLLLLTPSSRELLKNPEKRWWLTEKRINHRVPVLINPLNGPTFTTQTFNISRSGAFIAFMKPATLDSIGSFPSEIKAGQDLSVRLKLGDFFDIRCGAHVVRSSKATGDYPAGIGIQFDALSSKDKRTLKAYLKRIEGSQS